MHANLATKKIKSPAKSINTLMVVAALICTALGSACIALVTAPGDGIWYFYAKSLLSGERLYSDLHLIQQPVFITLNAIGISIFGDSYFEQRLIFIFVLIGYIYCSYSLASKIDAPSFVKAVVLLSFFMCAIHFEAYRFDDYHAFEGLLSLALTLTFAPTAPPQKTRLTHAFYGGILLGLAILTRINDGLAMLIASILILAIRNPSCALKQITVFMISATITIFGALILIRETPLTWLQATIIDALGAKGGSNVFITPLILIKNSAQFILNDTPFQFWKFTSLLFSVSILYYFLIKKTNHKPTIQILSTITAFTTTGITLYNLNIDSIVPGAAIVFLIASTFILLRLIQWTNQKKPTNLENNCLLLIPLSLYGSGAMSSGGHHFGLYFPMALTLLVAAINVKQKQWNSVTGIFALVTAGSMAIFGFCYRFNSPYSWHSYRVEPLTKERFIVNTNGAGPVPMTERNKNFIMPICDKIDATDADLLSIPFPYANYICGKKPWHGYVQTFFDTTNEKTIRLLISDIENKPPRYILYQQQLINLSGHEKIFNNGNPLPHRKLDTFIMEKITKNEWLIVHQENFGADSNWLLIDTKYIQEQ